MTSWQLDIAYFCEVNLVLTFLVVYKFIFKIQNLVKFFGRTAIYVCDVRYPYFGLKLCEDWILLTLSFLFQHWALDQQTIFLQCSHHSFHCQFREALQVDICHSFIAFVCVAFMLDLIFSNWLVIADTEHYTDLYFQWLWSNSPSTNILCKSIPYCNWLMIIFNQFLWVLHNMSIMMKFRKLDFSGFN